MEFACICMNGHPYPAGTFCAYHANPGWLRRAWYRVFPPWSDYPTAYRVMRAREDAAAAAYFAALRALEATDYCTICGADGRA